MAKISITNNLKKFLACPNVFFINQITEKLMGHIPGSCKNKQGLPSWSQKRVDLENHLLENILWHSIQHMRTQNEIKAITAVT
mmetsp:Transcript_37992/g.66414  ORF Transcript_37992/g.66414 Transcript_37992/m.66414 type:complete len:83 (+) Transcript_37992:394-642(+)